MFDIIFNLFKLFLYERHWRLITNITHSIINKPNKTKLIFYVVTYWNKHLSLMRVVIFPSLDYELSDDSRIIISKKMKGNFYVLFVGVWSRIMNLKKQNKNSVSINWIRWNHLHVSSTFLVTPCLTIRNIGKQIFYKHLRFFMN